MQFIYAHLFAKTSLKNIFLISLSRIQHSDKTLERIFYFIKQKNSKLLLNLKKCQVIKISSLIYLKQHDLFKTFLKIEKL